MKKHLIYATTLAIALLSGCATPQTTKTPTKYDPTTEARLRASYLKFFTDKTCQPSFNWGGTTAAGKGWTWAKNKSIGIPVAPGTPEKYTEYVVKADKPIIFIGYATPPPTPAGQITLFSWGPNCSSIAGTLIPEAGKDYEVYFDESKCQLIAREISDEDGLVSATKISLVPTPKC